MIKTHQFRASQTDHQGAKLTINASAITNAPMMMIPRLERMRLRLMANSRHRGCLATTMSATLLRRSKHA
jgi:hypothetical protein